MNYINKLQKNWYEAVFKLQVTITNQYTGNLEDITSKLAGTKTTRIDVHSKDSIDNSGCLSLLM